MPLPHKLQDQLDTLALFADRTERVQALIGIGEGYRPIPESDLPRTEDRRVPGCESEVFIGSQPQGQGLKYLFGVDNPQGISAMALAQILDEGLSGQPLRDVLSVPDEIVYEIFGRELSMGKSLGLINMVRSVKSEAQRALGRGLPEQ